MKNLRSLTFAKNNIEKNVKERVLFKNYKNVLNVRYIYAENVVMPQSVLLIKGEVDLVNCSSDVVAMSCP